MIWLPNVGFTSRTMICPKLNTHFVFVRTNIAYENECRADDERVEGHYRGMCVIDAAYTLQ